MSIPDVRFEWGRFLVTWPERFFCLSFSLSLPVFQGLFILGLENIWPTSPQYINSTACLNVAELVFILVCLINISTTCLLRDHYKCSGIISENIPIDNSVNPHVCTVCEWNVSKERPLKSRGIFMNRLDIFFISLAYLIYRTVAST